MDSGKDVSNIPRPIGPNISTWLVQADERNNAMLKKPLFDVNMRLYNNNTVYRKLITDIIDYMIVALKNKYANYPKLKGISGANVGIPFNIVVTRKRTKPNVYINPSYNKTKDAKMCTVTTNCGSICLEENIITERYDAITITYFNLNGYYITKRVDDKEAFTLQHEIDHNNGILITDRKV